MSKSVGIDPILTLSGFLTALFEIGMIAGLILLLSARPVPTKEAQPIEIQLRLSTTTAEPAATTAPSEAVSPISPNPKPDPLFDALLAFTPQQPVSSGPSIRYTPQPVHDAAPGILPPETLMDLDETPIQQLAQLGMPTKRTVQVVREDPLVPGREYSFEELSEFNFPNYQFVQDMLIAEYNDLLQRTPRERIHALTGVVTARIQLQTNGGGIVQIESSPSLDLNSIVLRALHFLPQGHTYQPITIRVRIQFGTPLQPQTP